MRFAIVAALILLVLSGCSSMQQAVTPSSPLGSDIGGLTVEQAVARLGTPTSDRVCQDGSRTLTWKRPNVQPAPQARANPSFAQATYTPSVRGFQARPVSVQETQATLVLKFDPTGRLAWWRVVR